MYLAHKTASLILLILAIAVLPLTNLNGQEMDEDINIDRIQTATFGSGCFWCTEAIFEQLKGVQTVTSGYSGGEIDNPTYQMISSGESGYAEVIQLTFDPNIISYQSLLEIFWKMHDPTTLNRQGADVGTQYRSVVFYHSDLQKTTAEFFKNELEKAKVWANPIVTEISPYTNFYMAESYHQNYYQNNSGNAYCRTVIAPKLKKFEQVFADRIRK